MRVTMWLRDDEAFLIKQITKTVDMILLAIYTLSKLDCAFIDTPQTFTVDRAVDSFVLLHNTRVQAMILVLIN